jgi:uncharacterized protein (TIGR02001 family)
VHALRRLSTICLLIALTPPALAFDLARDRWGGSLGVTTDYRLRGISQSDGSPAGQLDVHYQSPVGSASVGWFAGLWASTVRLYRQENQTVELNAYGGLVWALDDDWSAKLALSHYAHPWDSLARHYDYDDVTVGTAWRDQLFLSATWSPNMSIISSRGIVLNRSALAYDVTGRLPLVERLSAVGGVGYYDVSELAERGYWYGSAGLAYDLASWHFDVSRVQNSRAAREIFYGDQAENRWIATVVWTF